MQTKKLLLVILFVLLLSSCGGEEHGTSLEGTSWQLIHIDSHIIPSGANVAINFQDGQISGIAACNHYGGGFTLSFDGAFIAEALFMTEKYCTDEPLNQIEAAYIEALGGVTTAKVEGDELILTGQFGKLVFAIESR